MVSVSTHFDLAIIGTGSGNSIADGRFEDRRVAMIEDGIFGGTCINVGCIPTKMFVFPADLARGALAGPRLGVRTSSEGAHWQQIRDRIFGRVDEVSVSGREWRLQNPHVTLFEGHARFVDAHTLDTGTGETITADQIVVAAGSRPTVPEVEGLGDIGFHTSDTVMRIEELPKRMLILGGGYVAAEFAHIFGAFGTHVTIVNRSSTMLRSQDTEISERFTKVAQDQWDVRLDTEVTKIERYDAGVRAHLSDGGTVDADLVLVAVGRRPNTDGLDLERTGVLVDDGGVIVVDDNQRTNVDGIWALGDIANHWQLKHVSNHEARVIQHNLLHLDDPSSWLRARRNAVPSAVFSSPQVASVGISEQDAITQGIDHVVAKQAYGDVAYGWAMEDTTGFAKVLAEPATGRIIGAHLLGAQASNLVQPIVQAMAFGQTARQVAEDQYWIHPALMEVVENLLLQVPDHGG
jgi:mycothione reductase